MVPSPPPRHAVEQPEGSPVTLCVAGGSVFPPRHHDIPISLPSRAVGWSRRISARRLARFALLAPPDSVHESRGQPRGDDFPYDGRDNAQKPHGHTQRPVREGDDSCYKQECRGHSAEDGQEHEHSSSQQPGQQRSTLVVHGNLRLPTPTTACYSIRVRHTTAELILNVQRATP
jgi:hypothetical protein